MGVHFRNKLFIVCSAVILTVCAIGGIFAYQISSSRELRGEGTQESPYLISSRVDWEAFAYNVRHGFEQNDYFAGAYFSLTQDIDFKNKSVPAIDGFKGVFDGGGYRLKNIKKGRISTGGETESGLFNDVYDGAVIKNLVVENFTHSTKTDVYYRFGVIARTVHAGAKISDCHVTVQFDTPQSRYSASRLHEEFGGISATNLGTIEFCSVKMGETKKNTGGIVALNKGNIVDCYADVSGVQGGGIVYSNDEGGKITRCVANGYGRSVGGIFMYRSSFSGMVTNSVSTVVCDVTPFEIDGQTYSSFAEQYSGQEGCVYLYFDRYHATSAEFYASALRLYGEDGVHAKTAPLDFANLGNPGYFESLGFSTEYWVFEQGKSPRLVGSHSDGSIATP